MIDGGKRLSSLELQRLEEQMVVLAQRAVEAASKN